MKQNEMQKIIRIALAIIIFSIIINGISKLFPFIVLIIVIVLALSAMQRRGIRFGDLIKKAKTTHFAKPMIDYNSINKKIPDTKTIKKGINIIILFILIVFFLSITITVVPAGNVGVMDFFGSVSNRELVPGIQFKTPLSRVIMFDTRTIDFTMTSRIGEGAVYGDDSIAALTKEGLTVGLDITVLYHLEKGNSATLYKEVGKNYESKIIRPAIRTTIRDIVAKYNAEALYSDKREEAAVNILDKLKAKIEPRGIAIEDVLLRNVTLPAKLADAIEEKLKADQEAQRFDFVLQKEEKEAERKRIEAEGQRDAQKIINESLTTAYLEYLYIRELKDREGTIYVPTNPNNGLPLFRGL